MSIVGGSLSRYHFGQFIEISKSHIRLSLYRGFLEIREKKELLDRVALDDILGVVITGYGCSHSSNILVELVNRGIPVSICNASFVPQAIVLPLVANCYQNKRIQSQIDMSQPLRKRLWKTVVKLKLRHQALVLKEFGLPYRGLLNMSHLVKSGDSTHLEAQGARKYWPSLFSKDFRRDKKGDGVNAMLNYAYAIIRSCVARAIVTAGLHPGIGLHHRNVHNPMCLVDDLMEPFRPIGDYFVKQLSIQGFSEVDRDVKRALARIAIVDIEGESGTTSLFQLASHFSTSLALVLLEKKKWDVAFKVNWSHLKINCS